MDLNKITYFTRNMANYMASYFSTKTEDAQDVEKDKNKTPISALNQQKSAGPGAANAKPSNEEKQPNKTESVKVGEKDENTTPSPATNQQKGANSVPTNETQKPQNVPPLSVNIDQKNKSFISSQYVNKESNLEAYSGISRPLETSGEKGQAAATPLRSQQNEQHSNNDTKPKQQPSPDFQTPTAVQMARSTDPSYETLRGLDNAKVFGDDKSAEAKQQPSPEFKAPSAVQVARSTDPSYETLRGLNNADVFGKNKESNENDEGAYESADALDKTDPFSTHVVASSASGKLRSDQKDMEQVHH
ncbi:hypothetical protein RB195_001517 [Necator americanus]|uniref:Uncharacterized protein n=1 Tax=Necator americanus TaxID=51031 RepID=A0ABR1DF32_NECAM